MKRRTSREKKMTLPKGANPPSGAGKSHKLARAAGKGKDLRSKGGNAKIKDAPQPHVMSMMGKHPFELKAKKPEPDDRPRPARPPSTNKNAKSQNSARVKRLTGLML